MAEQQKRFSTLKAVLVIIIIGLVGFTTWFVLNAKSETEDIYSETAKVQTKTAATSKHKPSENIASGKTNDAKYLNITEWGVKVALSPEIDSAYYLYRANYPSAVYLSLDKYKSTECAADKTSVAAIFRYKAGEIDEMSGVPYTQSRGTTNKVGDYYYVVDHPQAYCSQIVSVQNEAETAFKAFSQNLQTIEAAE